MAARRRSRPAPVVVATPGPFNAWVPVGMYTATPHPYPDGTLPEGRTRRSRAHTRSLPERRMRLLRRIAAARADAAARGRRRRVGRVVRPVWEGYDPDAA